MKTKVIKTQEGIIVRNETDVWLTRIVEKETETFKVMESFSKSVEIPKGYLKISKKKEKRVSETELTFNDLNFFKFYMNKIDLGEHRKEILDLLTLALERNEFDKVRNTLFELAYEKNKE